MDNIKNYIGAIIGIIVGILFAVFDLWRPILIIGMVLPFGWLGNYAQKNKDDLKVKIKNFIDKIQGEI